MGVGGEIVPTDPASLSLNAASATISGPIISDEISCLGSATVEGQLAVTGGVTVGGSLTFDKDGVNARGSRIANAQLENVTFQGSVQGVVGFAGGVTIGTLQRNGDRGGALRVLATGSDGELMTMPGVEFMEEDEVLVVKSLSGHKVSNACPSNLCVVVRPPCRSRFAPDDASHFFNKRGLESLIHTRF